MQVRKELRMNSWLAIGLSVLVLPGCVVAADHGGHGAAPSTLTVDWTIDNTHDPAQCRQGDTPSIFITVESHAGTEFKETVDCEASSDTFALDPGHYWVTATLLDPDGDDATTTVESDDFDLLVDDDQTINIDFPADSFR
jgi:hypothetical protein